MVVVVEEKNEDDPAVVGVNHTSADVNGTPTGEATSRHNSAVSILRNCNRELSVDEGPTSCRDSRSLCTVEVVSYGVWGAARRNVSGWQMTLDSKKIRGCSQRVLVRLRGWRGLRALPLRRTGF